MLHFDIPFINFLKIIKTEKRVYGLYIMYLTCI